MTSLSHGNPARGPSYRQEELDQFRLAHLNNEQKKNQEHNLYPIALWSFDKNLLIDCLQPVMTQFGQTCKSVVAGIRSFLFFPYFYR